MQPLYDLNLQQVENTHLVGNWRVITRRVNQADPAAPLVQAHRLRFEVPDRLVLQPPDQTASTSSTEPAETGPEGVSSTASATGPVQVGTWSLQRDPLLSRPYLQLMLPDGATRALITRMRRSKDGHDCEMMLYFQTGMEVQLQCA